MLYIRSLLTLLVLVVPFASWCDQVEATVKTTGWALFTRAFSKGPPESLEAKKPVTEVKAKIPILEVKAGYFFFSDVTMRKIFGKGGLDLQISGSAPVGGWPWRWLQIYGSVEYIKRNGSSTQSHQSLSLWEIPLSVGLQPVFDLRSWLQWYLTFGPRYIFLHVHNHSKFVDQSVNKNGLGLFVNTGFHFFPYGHFTIDLYGEYSYKKMQVNSSKTNVYGPSMNVGGFAFGGGLGYAF